MAVRGQAWRPIAAYLYLLKVNRSALAWEYLRRNSDYRNDFVELAPNDPQWEARWGISAAYDPSLDSRVGSPGWSSALVDDRFDVIADGNARTDAERFSIWAIPGRKALSASRRALQLVARVGDHVLEMNIASDLCDGGSFAFVIHAGPTARKQIRAVEQYLEHLRRDGQHVREIAIHRPDRTGAPAHAVHTGLGRADSRCISA